MSKLPPRHQLAALFALALLSSVIPSAAQEQSSIALDSIDRSSIVAGEVLVRFKPGVSAETRDQVLALVGGVLVAPLESVDTVIAKVPAGTEISAAESLAVDPNVIAAEPVIEEAAVSP
jgi:hypothetical protein